MGNINFGIDLGTTNSGIARFKEGKVTLLKNPVGFRETLPSVVAYKAERILIGDKANEQLLTNPERVFSSFKRRMGTDETYEVEGVDYRTSPVDLSALVLKELFNFSLQEHIKSAVITIPASFDTIQSNATKKAGYQAGLQEVVLLQEPIAACLAYSNQNDLKLTGVENWLVYDFGGGTFDAAIVKIDAREMKVVDNNGNNFLGGVDLDEKIVMEIILPKLIAKTGDAKTWNQINDPANTTFQQLRKYLLYHAEELKKELSLKEEAWLDLNFEAFELNAEIQVKRTELNEIIQPIFEESYRLLVELLKANQLAFHDFSRIILVGGTTYIPYIRQELKARTKVLIDTSIDPTTAVIIGASFYAGNKISALANEEGLADTVLAEVPLDVLISVENQTQDQEELIAFRLKDAFSGAYRLRRNDGGFDSGLVRFNNQGSEFVSLLEKQVNYFTLTLYDEDEKVVFSKDNISITHGFYNINGQPLPNDICIELDADDETYLELIFKKNTILPLKKMIYKTFSKSIAQGSDDKIVINIVEGKVGSLPGANLNIGYIEINGTNLKGDLIRGTDIEMSFTISESRDLKVEIYIPSADQEIIETFNPTYQGDFDNLKLLSEINAGLEILREKIKDRELDEDFEELAKLSTLKEELEDVKGSVQLAIDGIFTLDKFKILDRKRRLLAAIDRLVFLEDLTEEIDGYNRAKDYLADKESHFTPTISNEFNLIVKDEKQFLQSGDKYLIRRKRSALDKLANTVYFSSDESYYSVFYQLHFLEASNYTDYGAVKKLLAEGENAVKNSEIKKLKAICEMIFRYLRNDDDKEQLFARTGIK